MATSKVKKSSYEGRQNNIRELSLPDIEVFENIYKDRDYRIDLEFPEFTAICPKTGLPDFGTVLISYHPGEFCIELKSLKEYFQSFRDVGIFHENAVNRIRDDIVKSCSPIRLRVFIEYNFRGGIKTRVTARFNKKGRNE